MVTGKAIVLTNGMLETDNAKTCHGLLRHTSRFDILGVVDHKFSGQDAGEILDGQPRNVPVVASVTDYFQANYDRPEYCIVGVALPGGNLPNEFRKDILEAISYGLHIVNGLHTLLNEDKEFKSAAKSAGASLIDIRRPRPATELSFWSGEIYQVEAQRIAVLGTDCAVGKRTTCQLLHQQCNKNGIRTEMMYTGQTGWMQGFNYGFIFDSTLNDFICGEIEKAIVRCDQEVQPELILVEGQSALRNPSGPCGSEFILGGNIKGIILQHAPGRKYYEGTEALKCAIPPITDEIKLINLYGAQVLAVTLNEEGMEPYQLVQYQKDLQTQLGIPVIRPLTEGFKELIPVIKNFI